MRCELLVDSKVKVLKRKLSADKSKYAGICEEPESWITSGRRSAKKCHHGDECDKS